MGISSIVSLVGTAIGILALLIVLFKQKGIFFKKFSFLLMLGCLTYYCFVVFIVDSGKILEYPHFFKTGSPVFYLLAISILWVGQAHLLEKEQLGKWDFAFLLIPILNFIEFLPFYIQSSEEKRLYLLELFADRDQIIYAFEGWVPTVFHYSFQLFLGIGISIFLIKKVKKRKKEINEENPSFDWLNLLAIIFLIFYLFGVSLLIIDNETIPIHQLASWLFGLMLVTQLFFLFFRPEILYGIRSSSKKIKHPTPIVLLDDHEVRNYQRIIEVYFNTHDEFLATEFRQQDLANRLNINKNRLSQIITQIYSQNFNQLINEKRIEIAIQKLENKDWKNLTIEGIAHKVGFKSRTTFNKAFQEKTNLTPSEFLKKVSKR